MAEHPISMSIETTTRKQEDQVSGAVVLKAGVRYALVKMYDDEADTVTLLRFPVKDPVIVAEPQPADDFDKAYAMEMIAVNERDFERRKAAALDG